MSMFGASLRRAVRPSLARSLRIRPGARRPNADEASAAVFHPSEPFFRPNDAPRQPQQAPPIQPPKALPKASKAAPVPPKAAPVPQTRQSAPRPKAAPPKAPRKAPKVPVHKHLEKAAVDAARDILMSFRSVADASDGDAANATARLKAAGWRPSLRADVPMSAAAKRAVALADAAKLEPAGEAKKADAAPPPEAVEDATLEAAVGDGATDSGVIARTISGPVRPNGPRTAAQGAADLAETLWKAATKSLLRCKTYKNVLNVVQRRVEDFNELNMSIALNLLARFKRNKIIIRSDMRTKRLIERTTHSILKCRAALSNSEEDDFFATPGPYLPPKRSSRKSAKDARNKKQPVVVLHLWSARDLTNVCWSIAKLEAHAPDLLQAAAVITHRNLERFNSRDLANSAWAFSTAGVQAPKLMGAVAAASLLKLESFNVRDLSTIAWSVSNAGLHHGALYDAVASKVLKNTKKEKILSQDAANLVWAYANAGLDHPLLFSAVALEVAGDRSKIQTFHRHELSKLVWAFSKTKFDAPLVFEAVAAESILKMQTFSEKHLATTAWAYANAGLQQPLLFEALKEHAIKKAAWFTDPKDVANLLWAFAKTENVEQKQDALFESFAKPVRDTLSRFEKEDLRRVAWAFSKTDVQIPPPEPDPEIP
ncbi:hypothetical protein M885DRAFT_525766 [Pelagophyceae sp. CCMP2097]|nr:hypothetical protein M885DRAFT_525766 [Pelagophyceae sp. CCMP2097]